MRRRDGGEAPGSFARVRCGAQGLDIQGFKRDGFGFVVCVRGGCCKTVTILEKPMCLNPALMLEELKWRSFLKPKP